MSSVELQRIGVHLRRTRLVESLSSTNNRLNILPVNSLPEIMFQASS